MDVRVIVIDWIKEDENMRWVSEWVSEWESERVSEWTSERMSARMRVCVRERENDKVREHFNASYKWERRKQIIVLFE